MGAREQFAGWGLYDNLAVCLTCGTKHLIPKAEQVSEQPWLNWLTKHPGHENFIVPYSVIGKLDGLRHNADAKIAYAASAAYTITLTGLATSSTLVAGRESSALVNTSNKYLDVLVSGQIMVGTTPTANTLIEVHAVGAVQDGGGTPTWPDVFDGTDSAETIGSVADGVAIKLNICKPIASCPVTVTTSDVPHPFAPLGIRQLFGDGLPVSHVIFVTHSTAVNLNATASNHAIHHTPVYATVI